MLNKCGGFAGKRSYVKTKWQVLLMEFGVELLPQRMARPEANTTANAASFLLITTNNNFIDS